MDWERATRRGALALIPLLAIGIYVFGQSDRAPEETPSPSASPATSSIAGLPPGVKPSPGAAALAEQGEAALGRGDAGSRPMALPSARPRPEKQAAQPRPKAPKRKSAIELEFVDPPSDGTRPIPPTPGPQERRSCGGVEVRAITTSPSNEWAFASISEKSGEQAKIKRVGDRVGGYRVTSIEWDRVWLAGAQGRCAAELNNTTRAALELAQAAGRVAPMADDMPAQTPWRLPSELRHAISQTSDGRIQIEKAMVKPLFLRAGQLLVGLELEPQSVDGAVRGLKLNKIKPDSLLAVLGFENGDTVLFLDDTPATSREAVSAALEHARKQGQLLVRFEREGQEHQLALLTT